MAGDTHAIDIGDDDLLPPWSTVFEVIAATDFTEWVLVGGLMVQLHAYRANIPPSRPTKDVDMVVDVVTARASVQDIAGQLRTINFEPVMPLSSRSPVYRFARGKEQVDLMVPDDLPSRIQPRFMMRPAFGVVAGNQAIRRRDVFQITSAAHSAIVGAPDVLGAIIAKGAAYLVDSRDSGRHLEDAALLLASVQAVSKLELSELSRNDKKHLVRVATMLPDNAAAWRELDDTNRLRGQRQLSRIVAAANLTLPDRKP
jgi:hypothetical protein